MIPKGSKVTLRASLAQVEKQLGRKPLQLQQLSEVERPEEAEYLWGWYLELFNGGKLTYQELDAWSRLTRRVLLPWEVRVLKTLDLIYLKVHCDGRS